MIWLALSAFSLAAWIYLAVFRGGFWRADIRLEAPTGASRTAKWPGVVAVIPARDEARTIARVVAAHMASTYPGPFGVVVVDDASSDGTADHARAAATGRRPFDVIAAPPLDEGWTGKLAAQRAGIAFARRRHPDAAYLLLTDADIRHAPDTLRRLVAKAQSEGLALVSLMARLDSRGPWGRLLIPAFVYFFQKLYPFAWSNDAARKTAAAAGGCMLVRADALHAAGGLEAIKGRLIDDCALASLLKHAGPGAPRRIWTGLSAGDVESLRDNRSLSSVWGMVSRTAFAQLGHSWVLLSGVVAGMVVTYLAAPLTILTAPFHRHVDATLISVAAMVSMAITYAPTLRLYGQPSWRALLLPAAAAFYVAMTVSSALQHASGRGGRWKGRTYP